MYQVLWTGRQISRNRSLPLEKRELEIQMKMNSMVQGGTGMSQQTTDMHEINRLIWNLGKTKGIVADVEIEE